MSHIFCWKLQSIEIQKKVGAFSMALDTINKCLSEAICALSRGRLDGESQTASLIQTGNEILDLDKYYPEIRFVYFSHGLPLLNVPCYPLVYMNGKILNFESWGST